MIIFLSYASDQRDVAEQTTLALTSLGHKVFFDRDSLPAGDDYHMRIRRAVEESEAFVFLISPKSVTPGSYTLTELKYARQKWPDPRQKVLPVIIERTEYRDIPNYLKAVTILEPEGSVQAEVAAELQQWAASRTLSHATPGAQQGPRTSDTLSAPGTAESVPSEIKVSGKAILSLMLVAAGSLALGEGPGFPFPESISRQNAVVMTLLSFVALGLAISAWADINKNKAKGKMLTLIAIAVSSIGILGLGLPLLLGW
jgi:hypothetical protein